MIINSLIEYYDRLSQSGTMPPFGFSIEDIGFAIIINKGGEIVGEPLDLRTKIKANHYVYKQSIVPYSNSVNVRSSGAAKTPNFLVDKADYIFGMSGNSLKATHHESFKKLIEEVCAGSNNAGITAVMAFLQNWRPENSLKLPYWKEISGINGKWVAFQLDGQRGFIHERAAVKEKWTEYISKRNI